MSDPKTIALLEDMRTYAQTALRFLGDLDVDAVLKDEMRHFALVRAVEVIGEAASKGSPDVRASIPQVPWRDVIGMRNLLIHGYGQVRAERVVETVRVHLPPPISALDSLLKETPE